MLLRDRSLHREQVLRLMLKLARMGKVYAVGNDYFVLPQHMAELASRAQALAQADPHRRLNVKALRETTGISRHLSVPLVEFFDRIGFTKRDEVGRHVRRDARDMFDGQQPQGPYDRAAIWRRIVPRWGVRSAKPGGAALRSQVGSTPTLFRHPRASLASRRRPLPSPAARLLARVAGCTAPAHAEPLAAARR